MPSPAPGGIRAVPNRNAFSVQPINAEDRARIQHLLDTRGFDDITLNEPTADGLRVISGFKKQDLNRGTYIFSVKLSDGTNMKFRDSDGVLFDFD